MAATRRYPVPKTMNENPYIQQGDPLLYQTLNGGEVTASDGLLQMSGGLPTAVYLSLFGGNFEDDGRPQNPLTWWGNVSEQSAAARYRSETQHQLDRLPATPANLRKIEDAVKRDLQWLLDERIASFVTVAVSMPALNRVQIDIDVGAYGEESRFQFVECWRAEGFIPENVALSPEWRTLENYYPRLTESGEIRLMEPA